MSRSQIKYSGIVDFLHMLSLNHEANIHWILVEVHHSYLLLYRSSWRIQWRTLVRSWWGKRLPRPMTWLVMGQLHQLFLHKVLLLKVSRCVRWFIHGTWRKSGCVFLINWCNLLQVVAAGANPVLITRGIEKTTKALVTELKLMSKEVMLICLYKVASVFQ